MIFRTSNRTLTPSTQIKEDSSIIRIETQVIRYNDEFGRNEVILDYVPRGAIISCIIHGQGSEGDIVVDGEFNIATSTKTIAFLNGTSYAAHSCEVKYLIEG